MGSTRKGMLNVLIAAVLWGRSGVCAQYIKERSIPVNHPVATLQPGDVVIGNDSFGQYKGEVNIVKQSMPNIDQHKNVVGHLVADEQFLIPYIRPWMKFRFEDAQAHK